MRTFTILLSAVLFFSVSYGQKKTNLPRKSKRIEKIINSQWTFNYFPDENAEKGYESQVTMIQNGLR